MHVKTSACTPVFEATWAVAFGTAVCADLLLSIDVLYMARIFIRVFVIVL